MHPRAAAPSRPSLPSLARPRGRDGLLPRLLPLALLLGIALALTGGCASKPTSEAVSRVDSVVVRKGDRRMDLIKDGAVYRSYRIALGDQPQGHKMEEGDERTPEGEYFIDLRNPNSGYYKSIRISYPNARDRAFARALGVQPGGWVMIHGRPNWLTSPAVAREYDGRDWTNGCIAVTNEEMDEIWRLVPVGTPIKILP